MGSVKKNTHVLEQGEVSKRLGYWNLTKSVTPSQIEEFWTRVEHKRLDHRPYRQKRFPPHLIEYLDELTNLGWFDVSANQSEDISKDIMIEMECPDLYQEFRHMLHCLREKDFPDACMILKPEHLRTVGSSESHKIFPRMIPYLLVDKSPIPPDPSGFPEIQGDLPQLTALARQEPIWTTRAREYWERMKRELSNSLSSIQSTRHSISSVNNGLVIPRNRASSGPQKRSHSTASTASVGPRKKTNYGPPRRSYSTNSMASVNMKRSGSSISSSQPLKRVASTGVRRSLPPASPAAKKHSSAASMGRTTSTNSITSSAGSTSRKTIPSPKPRWR